MQSSTNFGVLGLNSSELNSLELSHTFAWLKRQESGLLVLTISIGLLFHQFLSSRFRVIEWSIDRTILLFCVIHNPGENVGDKSLYTTALSVGDAYGPCGTHGRRFL